MHTVQYKMKTSAELKGVPVRDLAASEASMIIAEFALDKCSTMWG
jgi:hypothetical protein